MNVVPVYKTQTVVVNMHVDSGFLKRRSTSTQLLNILNEWTEYVERGGHVDVICTDFSQTFDKVSHKSVIHKL